MVDYASDLRKLLHHMRTNVYKEKILTILNKNHLLSISDIHKEIRDVDYSTVYRNIKQLTTEDKIKEVVLEKNNVMYEVAHAENQHDHFLCLVCGDVEMVQVPMDKILPSSKYTISDIVIKGICAKCH